MPTLCQFGASYAIFYACFFGLRTGNIVHAPIYQVGTTEYLQTLD